MPKRISRRALVRGIGGAAAGGVLAGAAIAEAAPKQETITGRVRWCNRRLGIVSFGPDREDASNVTMQLALRADEYDDDVDKKLKRLMRPQAPVSVTFSWRPDLDFLKPWQPLEVICADGERLAIEPGGTEVTDAATAYLVADAGERSN